MVSPPNMTVQEQFYFGLLVSWMSVCVCVCSWPAALNETRVQTNVTDVMTVQQPGEKAFQTQTITSMRTRAELPL